MSKEISCNADSVLKEIEKLYARRRAYNKPITEIGVDTLSLTRHITLAKLEPMLNELEKEGKIVFNSSLVRGKTMTKLTDRGTVSLVLK